MQRYSAKLIVVSDVLGMFIKADPQIDPDEARWMIKEIARALKRLSAQAMIVVSMSPSSNMPLPPSYAGTLLRIFDSCIDIMVANDTHSVNCLQLRVSDLRHGTTRMVTIPKKDLQLVPAR
jgi:hypothetical protein